MSTGNGNDELDPIVREKLQEVIDDNNVLLFMKGDKTMPQCGFSNTACRILDAIGCDYSTVNVLDDDRIRNGVKILSSWPTIPQLYVKKEFVGGCDIVKEMFENGELKKLFEDKQIKYKK